METGFPYSVPANDLAQTCKEEGLQQVLQFNTSSETDLDSSSSSSTKTKSIVFLHQVLINTFPGDNLGFGGRVGEQHQFMESLKRSLEYCTLLDCHLLHIMAGR